MATGKGVQITAPPDGPHNDLVQWTSDGSHVAYASNLTCEEVHCEVYRKRGDGEGSRELLFRWAEPGAPVESLDFSADGRFLSFASGSALFVAPLTGTDPLAREAIAVSSEDFMQQWPTFSPDSRFLAYMSTEAGNRADYYVRSVDVASGKLGDGKWRITTHGPAVGGSVWRPDGREILYTRRLNESPSPAGQIEVMAVEVTTTPTFQASEPRVLFRLPAPTPSFTSRASQSFTHDGQTFAFLVPVPFPGGSAR